MECKTIEFHSDCGGKPVTVKVDRDRYTPLYTTNVVKVVIDCEPDNILRREVVSIVEGNYNKNAVYYNSEGEEVDVKTYKDVILWQHLYAYPIGLLIMFMGHEAVVDAYSDKDLVCVYYGGGEYKAVKINHRIIAAKSKAVSIIE